MIFVAGSANLDFVVRAPRIPTPGETVLGRDFKTFPGGKGANQAVACARAGGMATAMLLALGDDPYAALIENSLADAGVTMHKVRAAGQPTGCAFICVSDDAENAITVAPGANSCLRAEHLPPLQGFTHLLLQLEIPMETVSAYASSARAQGVCVMLNAAPAQAISPELLEQLDILVVNEAELATIAEPQTGIAQCLASLAVPCVVVTLGARGCVARLDGKFYTQPGFSVQAVDTTAAGDTFCGVLAAALSAGSGMQDALIQACAAGALTCTQAGAQESIPSVDELQAFLHSAPAGSAEQHAALRRSCDITDPLLSCAAEPGTA